MSAYLRARNKTYKIRHEIQKKGRRRLRVDIERPGDSSPQEQGPRAPPLFCFPSFPQESWTRTKSSGALQKKTKNGHSTKSSSQERCPSHPLRRLFFLGCTRTALNSSCIRSVFSPGLADAMPGSSLLEIVSYSYASSHRCCEVCRSSLRFVCCAILPSCRPGKLRKGRKDTGVAPPITAVAVPGPQPVSLLQPGGQ